MPALISGASGHVGRVLASRSASATPARGDFVVRRVMPFRAGDGAKASAGVVAILQWLVDWLLPSPPAVLSAGRSRVGTLSRTAPLDALRRTAACCRGPTAASGKTARRLHGDASAAMTLASIGLVDEALGVLAERMDAARDAHKTARTVGTVWARGNLMKIDDHHASR